MLISSAHSALSDEWLGAAGALLGGLGFVALTVIPRTSVRANWFEEAQAIVAMLGPSAVVLVLSHFDFLPGRTLFVSLGIGLLLVSIVAMLQVRRREKIQQTANPAS
jgi:hypothetical protein